MGSSNSADGTENTQPRERHQPIHEIASEMAQIPSITVRIVNRSWIKENPDNVSTNNHKHSELPARLQAIEQALDWSKYYQRLTKTVYDPWKPILQRMQHEAKETQEPISPCNEGHEISSGRRNTHGTNPEEFRGRY
ncbi:uncharacterized protein DFL_002161 [Arthrobotrys flagrans]|uniref:Uncharacterized protein n=1 Tax=Arthrobotrys flagrans TaxID=97331 RepID=A0A437A9Q5_ARTFL|nr:hypothetical protein DFL_002161 [Arthrobotrys flagrans]